MSILEDEIAFTTRAVKKNAKNVEGRLHLAKLLMKAGRTKEALEQLAAATQIDPARPLTYRLMAKIFRRMGREKDAARADDFAQSLEGKRK